ncbi:MULTISPECIES: ATP-binding protein [Phyllobacteriaceae]|jgi:two-component system, OmpR family, sensor histidine kinase AdeS|uniref:histidine kinase n=1 Tax=Mesorhizobium hungaricum TaxID=1566387 RepID=A0A1C2E0S1_9HYPH|nr:MULTISPECIES: ATP-binding protein [Mesorhizobium]MBN9235473.1 HAMP domain-containing protein [Mesorhizobium sp.]MDQ0331374.1 two-component system sensor histidine kinase AdeS [Mesorhizobium sp. YL-MeA3-2017]OCX20624.1 two-component sensor histidine kinase [Mesorhizobium hungaricum]
MKSATGLNRHLVIWMAAVTGVALAAMIAGMVLFYALVEYIDPAFWRKDWNSNWPQPLEWGAFITFWALGMVGASAAAAYFTRRIIRPLEAVGSAAQRIALGDLTARAAPQGAMFDETRQLVDDFNAMADQLRQAEVEMRAWNVAIAHELRTPLTILKGRLQGIVDGVFASETISFEGLVAQVDSLTRIVEDLKVFTLAQSGRLELQLEPVDLAEEVAKVASFVTPELQDAGINLLFDLGGSVQVMADSARVRQAILAILENARRYAAPGLLRIEMRATRETGILRFCDDGPGLPLGAERLVFEPFWRADESRSRAKGGSGLGLAVVQAIAQAHGGVALARAANPTGAIFEIHLPRAQVART